MKTSHNQTHNSEIARPSRNSLWCLVLLETVSQLETRVRWCSQGSGLTTRPCAFLADTPYGTAGHERKQRG